MTVSKRLFDLLFALCLCTVLGPVLLVLLGWLLLREGRPLFYVAERIGQDGRPFLLWKLRTMTVARADSGVSGGDKTDRITATGAWLRRRRLDEFPQLWNILRGDLSFVGPRPPLRVYTERFPDLYGQVLRSRPGVTGLATVIFHSHEARLLAPCTTAAQTDAVYVRACIPRKARLDLIYQARRNFCLDLWIIWQTMARVFGRPGRGA